jgi:outer membrane murein-binding lipoprotein Lpp
MDDEYKVEKPEQRDERPSSASGAGVWVAVVIVLVIALVGFGYGYNQQSKVNQLNSQNSGMNSQIAQMQQQMSSMSDKMSQMSAAQSTPASNTPSASTSGAPISSATRRRIAAQDHQIKQMQGQIDDQQKQLSDEKDQVAQARSDLEGSINSTRDDLNGSIARTHDELVALEQKGERNYFEFDLSTKPKKFAHEGPIQLSLRKADAKHKNFDLAMIVDDNQMTKKRVNLYEPIWVHSGDDMDSMQIVVNKISKDHVHGYVSAPKYSAAVSPVSTNPAPSDSSPKQPAPDLNPPVDPEMNPER